MCDEAAAEEDDGELSAGLEPPVERGVDDALAAGIRPGSMNR